MTSPCTWLITFIAVDEQGVSVVLKDAMSQISFLV